MRAQDLATKEGEHGTAGRCAQNLGIIANMRGEYGRAVGAFTMAIAAYERAGYGRGVAESLHNLGITYRDLGNLDQAKQTADRAVHDARRLGDHVLCGYALAGRAETWLAQREPALAIREAERAMAMHRELGDEVAVTEDLRILAVALAARGETDEAQRRLREVIDRAAVHTRPHLVASAQRDLARVLQHVGRTDEAQELACLARETFERLGVRVEVEKLDDLLEALAPTG